MKAGNADEFKQELLSTNCLEDFIKNHEGEFQNQKYTFQQYLNHLLREKQLNKADVIARSGIEHTYAYHIFAGRKKTTSRLNVLCLALAMQLSVEEAQHLLYCAGVEYLYVRNRWDSIILFALEHHLSVIEANEFLERLSDGPILNNPDANELP